MTTMTSPGVREGEALTPSDAPRHLRLGSPDDIDEIAVERAMQGDPSGLTTCWERREAVRRLHNYRYSQPQIAARLDIHERQVNRDLEKFGLTFTGLWRGRQVEAARRRPVLTRLAAAGCGRAEAAQLLRVSVAVIASDARVLGLSFRKANRYTSRTYPELLALYGHLLTQSERATG